MKAETRKMGLFRFIVAWVLALIKHKPKRSLCYEGFHLDRERVRVSLVQLFEKVHNEKVEFC